jgi:hypothetical protein
MLQKTLSRKAIGKIFRKYGIFQSISENRFYFSPKYLKENAVFKETE